MLGKRKKKKTKKVVKVVTMCRRRWRPYSLLPFPLSWGLGGTESMVLEAKLPSSWVATETNWELGDSASGGKDCSGLRKGEGARAGC
jgi:hypothetical protein